LTTRSLYRRKTTQTDRYDVLLDAPDGEALVTGSRTPTFDAARALLARGENRPFTLYAPSLTEAGKWTPTFVVRDVGGAAELTAEDDRFGTPTIRKHRPRPAMAM
jgi:hypothetical protein